MQQKAKAAGKFKRRAPRAKIDQIRELEAQGVGAVIVKLVATTINRR